VRRGIPTGHEWSSRSLRKVSKLHVRAPEENLLGALVHFYKILPIFHIWHIVNAQDRPAQKGHVAELVYAYASEAYPSQVGSSNLPVTTKCYNLTTFNSIN
jgi:hypothetical protein